MLEKIKKFILEHKKLLILILGIVIFLIITLLIIFKFFINNEFYYSESKTANDSKTALNTLYQEYEKSKATFKVYGDVTAKANISMKTTCDGKTETVTLSTKPVVVNNHCIITLTSNVGLANSLNAYITTPDGSLVTLSSYNTPELQLNAYKNETRIIIKSGTVYSRISKQTKNKTFNIQIGNLILKSSSGAEVSADANALDPKSTFDLLYGGYTVNGNKYYEKIETDTIVGIAGFRVIKGTTKIYQRDDMHVIGGKDHKHFIFFGNSTPYETIYFTDNGAENFKGYYMANEEAVEKLIESQETLNENKELDFIGIIDHDADNDQSRIDEIMKKYHDYYANKNNNNENENEENNDEEENNNSNNEGACEIYTELSGFTPSGICWCRNDFHISDNNLSEVNNKGYNYSKADFIYCYTFTDDGYTEGYMIKDCAESLGWPGTYSNEGGYVCN